MKIKKVLVLVIAIFFIFILSNNVFAVIPEEFKSILNEEGKLVITDTANIENNKYSVLLGSVLNKNKTDEYVFNAYFINAENTKCRIQRYQKEPYTILESYDVEVVYEEKFSNEFKKVTEDGNIVITSTSTQGKEILLMNYCDIYRNGSFSFTFTDLNEDKTIGTLQMYKYDSDRSELIEQHKVNISYEEKFSDEFKKISEDGTITIRASREEGKENLIYYYCSSLGDENLYFNVTDINEDGTLCTIKMEEPVIIDNMHTSVLKEQHIVKVQYDKTMSENFKKYLNKEGKFVIDSVIPQSKYELCYMFEIKYSNKGIWVDSEYIAEDLSSAEISIEDSKGIPEFHKVEFKYNYDEKIKKIVDEITQKISKDEAYIFNVKDMELINYWINGEELEDNRSTFDNYSSEFKEFVDYKNFSFFINNRLGADVEFFTLRGGIAIIEHKDIVYYINEMMGTLGNHILYVPDNTESTKEALLEAVQKRVDEYAGKGKVKITAGEGNILGYYKNIRDNEIKEVQKLLEIEMAKENPDRDLIGRYENRIEAAELDYNSSIENYNNPDGELYFLQKAEGNYWFVATINGVEHRFIVVKDSEKMFNPKHITKDVKTDVEISTDSNDIPLDTFIEAEQLSEGEEYEKIIKILDVEENVTYDLNLHSKSLNRYIERLENGMFKVKIPVPENLKNKKLMVYYVDENGNKEEYNVEIKDGYAIFTTNHFSIYTLAEEKLKLEKDIVSDNKENINDSVNTGNIGNDAENNGENKENNISNPKTGDNIVFFGVMFIISLIGIIFTTGLKKEGKEK